MAKISKFGKKIAKSSGIGQLMHDLGSAQAKGRAMLMLGGGNPAHIPQVQKHFRQCVRNMLDNADDFERAIGSYDRPQGNREFIEAIAELLAGEFGWQTGPENIALTNGSQSAFFILFNIFAGAFEDGSTKKILLPLAPEYIGYSDVGLAENLFIANKPEIEHIEEHVFKYHIDFDRLQVTADVGAICVSRPTNPTGNVLTDLEIDGLTRLARSNDIPLIIDGAYGLPFPNIVFTKARAFWNENTVLCLSLSKLGLPGARTGIVVASEEIVSMVSETNAVMSLAPGGIGAAIATELVRSGRIICLSQDVIQPFYQNKAAEALQLLSAELDGVDFHVHKPEGAFFLWLWLRNLPITSAQLYDRLKKRGVLVVPGHYFFPGLAEPWQHKNECIRINYAPDSERVTAGIKVVADEVKRAYKGL
jgi:valine--pyruvate aminotransferase